MMTKELFPCMKFMILFLRILAAVCLYSKRIPTRYPGYFSSSRRFFEIWHIFKPMSIMPDSSLSKGSFFKPLDISVKIMNDLKDLAEPPQLMNKLWPCFHRPARPLPLNVILHGELRISE